MVEGALIASNLVKRNQLVLIWYSESVAQEISKAVWNRLTTYISCYNPAQVIFMQGEADMGDKGKKDKGRREQQKESKRSPKEKRRLKKEKKNK